MWLKVNIMHFWFIEMLCVIDCGSVLENIVTYMIDEMTILVVIWFRYVGLNLVSHAC